jgi:hypothetical protein
MHDPEVVALVEAELLIASLVCLPLVPHLMNAALSPLEYFRSPELR